MKRMHLLAWFFLFAMSAGAQLKIGVKAGLGISNQANPFIYNFSVKPDYNKGQAVSGVNAGLFTQFNLAEKIDLRIQLAIASEGYKLPESHDDQGNLTSPAQKFRLSYLVLPVQVSYLVKVKPGNVWIGAGPYVAFLVDGNIKLPSGHTDISIGNTQLDQFKPVEFGISPTIGITLKNGLLFGIDYNLGLSDVSTSSDNSRNTCWSFYIGYTLKNH